MFKNAPKGAGFQKEFYEINDVLQGNKTPCFYALDKNQKGCRVYLHEVK